MKKILLFVLAGIMSSGAFAASLPQLRQTKHPHPTSENMRVMPDKNIKERKMSSRMTEINNLDLQKSPVTNNPFKVNTGTRDGGDNFYGYMVYSNSDVYLGLFDITPGDGYSLYFEDPGFEELGFDLVPYNGWYVDGKLNGYSLYYYDPYTIAGSFTYSIDFETGQLLDYMEDYYWFDHEVIFEICTLNTDDGLIYGYAVDTSSEYWTYYWACASQDNPNDIQIIREAEYAENFVSICYKADEGVFYGLTSFFDFVKIDPRGNLEYISYAPYYEDAGFYNFQTGLIWDAADEVFYWNAQLMDYNYGMISGTLYSITQEGEFEFIEQYDSDQQFSFFVSTEEYINEEAPLSPTIDSVVFEGASLEGVMTVTMPETYGDGSALPENITYTALLNDDIYKTAYAAPGEQIMINYVVAQSGNQTFQIYVTSNGMDSKTASLVKYVGYDVPEAPAEVLLSPEEISWSPVVGGVHNGYVDVDNVSYIVYLNDEVLDIVKTTSYNINLLGNAGLQRYTAGVIAVAEGLNSELTESNTIIAGQPLNLPLSYIPTEEEFENMTIVNANGDSFLYGEGEITWTLTQHGLWSNGTEFSGSYMDDYIFLPPVELKAGDIYSIAFETGRYSDWFPDEYLNVVYGFSPAPYGVVGTILQDFTPSAFLSPSNFENWDRVEELFTVEEDGTYYIGFQCVSAPQQYGIYIRNIDLTLNKTVMVETIEKEQGNIITSDGNNIIIKGFAGEQIVIARIDGRIVYEENMVENQGSYTVNPGIYVVKAGRRVAKIVVR